MKYVSVSRASEITGLCINTLRKLCDDDKIKHTITTGGHRRIDISQYPSEPERVVFTVGYCRVSSQKQKDDLERQIEFIRNKVPEATIVKDIGSGINFKRKGLAAILERAMSGESIKLVVAYKDLVSELHNKTALWLVKNFDVIFIPKFETSQMTSKKNKAVRKLTRKTTRNMLTFAHYQFQEQLKLKASIFGKCVVQPSEAYTSKTRSWDGVLMNIGSKEWITDGLVTVDRDLNGARGIFLRALVDTPFRLIPDAEPSQICNSRF